MAVPPLTVKALCKEEMEYHQNFGHTLGRIHNISLMSIIDICYTACHTSTQTVAHTIPGFRDIRCCIQYMASQPHRTIFILLILFMDQILLYLHGVGIKLKTTLHRIV